MATKSRIRFLLATAGALLFGFAILISVCVLPFALGRQNASVVKSAENVPIVSEITRQLETTGDLYVIVHEGPHNDFSVTVFGGCTRGSFNRFVQRSRLSRFNNGGDMFNTYLEKVPMQHRQEEAFGSNDPWFTGPQRSDAISGVEKIMAVYRRSDGRFIINVHGTYGPGVKYTGRTETDNGAKSQ